MHHIGLLIFLILVTLVAGEELVHLFFVHLAEACAWIVLAITLVGGFYLGCYFAYPVWVAFRNALGSTTAHAIVDPITVAAVFLIPIALILLDRMGRLGLVATPFVWAGRGLWQFAHFPAARRAWWQQYRIVDATHTTYAPYLWLARLRAPRGASIQRRQPVPPADRPRTLRVNGIACTPPDHHIAWEKARKGWL
jgi:hypothetical protein